jgi:imidazolonepropionase-like amidohydrolase
MQQRTGATWAARQAMTGALHQAGVTVVSGVDAGISSGKPHGILALAIADLIAGGIPAPGALATAISLAAGACGLGDRKGSLRAGYDADLVLVDGDPLTDIAALRAVRAVYLGGRAIQP